MGNAGSRVSREELLKKTLEHAEEARTLDAQILVAQAVLAGIDIYEEAAAKAMGAAVAAKAVSYAVGIAAAEEAAKAAAMAAEAAAAAAAEAAEAAAAAAAEEAAAEAAAAARRSTRIAVATPKEKAASMVAASSPDSVLDVTLMPTPPQADALAEINTEIAEPVKGEKRTAAKGGCRSAAFWMLGGLLLLFAGASQLPSHLSEGAMARAARSLPREHPSRHPSSPVPACSSRELWSAHEPWSAALCAASNIMGVVTGALVVDSTATREAATTETETEAAETEAVAGKVTAAEEAATKMAAAKAAEERAAKKVLEEATRKAEEAAKADAEAAEAAALVDAAAAADTITVEAQPATGAAAVTSKRMPAAGSAPVAIATQAADAATAARQLPDKSEKSARRGVSKPLHPALHALGTSLGAVGKLAAKLGGAALYLGPPVLVIPLKLLCRDGA